MSIVLVPIHSQSNTDAAGEYSRVIHVVYDDSGSMIKEDDKDVYLDRWAQAKYAMEVFAAMLDDKDSMSVYYMSDFDTARGRTPNPFARFTISGHDPMDSRVAKVHGTITYAYNTSYDTVSKAYEDLKKKNANEKWLVVLTDGEFNILNGQWVDVGREGPIPVDSYFSQYVNESRVKIYLLAMGDKAQVISANPDRGIYFGQAKDSNEILGKITSICNLIFNRNKLRFTNEAIREFSFDIPMSELLMFAQGKDVKVNNISGSNTYSPGKPVNVRYSEVAAMNPEFYGNPKVIPPKNLTGVVVPFRNIKKGSYKLDVIGAETVEVYYKPDVKVDIKLYRDGKEIRTNNITEGKYQIQYGIIDENGKFFESSLLREVTYNATTQNNGQTSKIESGGTINLSQGDLRVNVLAHFLEINTAENKVTYKVLPKLSFKEQLRNWIKENWHILRPLLILLLGLLLWWLLWGRKKHFPKYMARRPEITVENDSGTRIDSHSGYFKLDKKTKFIPFWPEKGVINAVADGKPLPLLKVKALGNERMVLTNTGDFAADRLRGADFYINDEPLPEGSTRNKEMSCTARIKSVYYNEGNQTTYTCSFAKKGKRRRK
jgi:hypothetical protein